MVVDKSGSMQPIASDVVGGFNRFVAEQKAAGGEDDRITFIQFDIEPHVAMDRVALRGISELSPGAYRPGGSTALLDAMGFAISRTMEMVGKDGKAIFCVMTDGQENASRHYTQQAVRALVESTERERGWRFVFVGAGIDAFAEGGKIGVAAANTLATTRSAAGVAQATSLYSASVSAYRAESSAPAEAKP